MNVSQSKFSYLRAAVLCAFQQFTSFSVPLLVFAHSESYSDWRMAWRGSRASCSCRLVGIGRAMAANPYLFLQTGYPYSFLQTGYKVKRWAFMYRYFSVSHQL